MKLERLDESIFSLTDSEVWWRNQYHVLESRGYRLRERLSPDWIPSWRKNPRLRPEDCDDSIENFHRLTTEATRISDGFKVYLKKVTRESEEASIALFLSLQEDVKNHCVPILDKLEDDSFPDFEIIVMPLLRDFSSPPFFSVEEVVDFVRQTLEGIAFIHSKDVAHRDCSDLNIMLDGTPLYPEGSHPIRQNMRSSGRGRAVYVRRSEVPSVKYYFTDFGLSSHFTDPNETRLVTGSVCQSRVPELSDFIPYDPFALDIYLLGDLYKRHFIDKYNNMAFLAPLVESMMQKIPTDRPTSDEALKTFEDLVLQTPDHVLRWRLIDSDLGRMSRFIINAKCISHEGFVLTKRFLSTYLVSLRSRLRGKLTQSHGSTGQ